MYQVLIRKTTEGNYNAVACELCYLNLRGDMQKQGINLSQIFEMDVQNMSFYVDRGEPTEELIERLKQFGDARLIPLSTGDFVNDLKIRVHSYFNALLEEEREGFIEEVSELVGILRGQ